MNRIEFMTTLASLLQDIPAEERREAMKYYNDYFDDAGAENEKQVIEELGSPGKVAATIKEGIDGYENENGEFTDTGYHDSKFESQEVPGPRKVGQSENDNTDSKKERWTSKPLKIALIIAIIIFAVPVVLPVVMGILAAAAGLIIAFIMVLIAIVISAIAIVISGGAIFVIGLVHLFTEFAVGLALTGIGLILLPLGAIALVASIKLCIVVIPGIIRGVVWLVRKPFQRKAVA